MLNDSNLEYLNKVALRNISTVVKLNNFEQNKKYLEKLNKRENIKCQNCGAENSTVWLHSSVRVPRKDASKKVWKNFYKLFVDNRK